jgi:adenylosuccinate lyase
MDRLMKEEAFQLSSDEIRDILRPELYIGRCPQQVEQFLAKVAPLIEGIEEESADINL